MTPRAEARLVVPAVAVWAGAGLAGTRALWVAAALTVAATLLTRRALRRTAALGLCFLLVGAGVAATRVSARGQGPLPGLVERRSVVSVEVVLTGDPVRQSGSVLGARRTEGAVRVRARAERLGVDDVFVRTRHPLTLLVDDPGWLARIPGERWLVSGRLGDSPDPAVVGTLRISGPARQLARAPVHQRVAQRLRLGLREATRGLPAGPRGLVPAMVDGDTAELDPATREEFQRAGLSHVLVVSGTNCAIVLAVAVLLLRRLGAGPRWTTALAAASLAGFVVLARPTPSVLRAAAMGAIGLLATATGRERRGLVVLCAAVLGLLLIDPALARAPGFALSTAATAGLVVLAPRWRAALARRWPPWLADAVAVPLAAQAACVPVLAALFGQVGLVGLPANLLAVPAVGATTVGGVVVAALAVVWLPAAAALARLVALPAEWILLVARVGARAPGAVVGWPRGVSGALAAALAVLLVGTLLSRAATRTALVVSLSAGLVAAALVWAVRPPWPPAGWRLVACDVGQGDGLVLRTSAGAVVVDTGPDPAGFERCLRRLRVRRVALLVLTHLHADHVEGVPGLLRAASVGRVLTGPLDEPAEQLVRVRGWLAARGLALERSARGQVWRVGDVTLTVLGPEAAFRGTPSDPNNSSVVLLVRAGSLRLLLTGDVEQAAQRGLLAGGGLGPVDVVKVPHHGSDRQQPGLLVATGARVALTSVGADNPYGHPSARTLDAAAAAGMRSLRTDVDGDLAVGMSETGALLVTGRRGSGRPPAPAPLSFAPSPVSAIAWCRPRAPPVGELARAPRIFDDLAAVVHSRCHRGVCLQRLR